MQPQLKWRPLAALLAALMLPYSGGLQAQQPAVPINPFMMLPTRPPNPPATAATPPAPVLPQNPAGVSRTEAAPAPAPASAPTAAAAPAASVAAPAPTAPAALAPTAAAVASTTAPGGAITLKFDNADVYEVIQAVLGDILGLDYVIDPSLQGKVTVKSSGAVSLPDVYNVLDAALSLSHISIIKTGKVYRVVRDASAVRDGIGFKAEGDNTPIIQIIPVQHVQASHLANTLRNFIGTQAAMTNDPTNHYLIVADRAANVAKMVDMVKTLDVDYMQQVRIRRVTLERADAAELSRELDALFKTSGLLNWSGTDGNKVFFLPVPRMNAIVIAAANDSLLEAAEKWVQTLDEEPKNGLGTQIHIYPVANSTAGHLAGIIGQLFGGSASSTGLRTTGSVPNQAAGATPPPGTAGTANDPTRTVSKGSVPGAGAATASGSGLAGVVQVIPDEATNTLVIKASPQDYQQIRKVIERIDTLPRQVLIQVMVAEVTLTDTLQYGIEWWMNSNLTHNGKSWATKTGIEGIIKPPTSTVVSGAGSGLNYAVFNGAGQVVGLLNLLGQDTDVNVLSAPHVLASDGKTAKIEVGNDEPVVTQTVSTPTTTTGNLTTSNAVQYRPTGILLEVKPSINASGMVSMSITQEVSGRAGTVSVGGSEYPNFSKRKVTTDVSIEEGKTLMIAGLIQNRGNASVTGLPLLKDVPIFGGLFGSTKNTVDKTELMITITPYIVRNRDEGDRITGAFQESLKDLRDLMDKRPRSQLDTPPAPRARKGEAPAALREVAGG